MRVHFGKKSRVSGAGSSRHPLGIFREQIIAKKGRKSKEKCDIFMKYFFFVINNLWLAQSAFPQARR